MENQYFLEAIANNFTIHVISLLWNFILTFCIVYLTCFANGADKKINKMYKHLEDDMEQEEIMNG